MLKRSKEFLFTLMVLMFITLGVSYGKDNTFIVSLSTVQGSGSVYTGVAEVEFVYVWNYSTATASVCISAGNNTLKGILTLATNTSGVMPLYETRITNPCVYITTQCATGSEITAVGLMPGTVAGWNTVYANQIGCYVIYNKR